MAAILKGQQLQPGSLAVAPIVFNVEDVQSRARDYLAEVQRQAAELLEQAHREAAEIKQRARQDGLREAQQQNDQRIEEAAAQLSDQRCRSAIAACQQSVEQLVESTAQWLTEWRNQTVELAARIAEKLVRHQSRQDSELLRVWMEEAIVAMRDERDVRVLVHPDDFAVAGRFLQSLAKSIPHAGSVEVVPDPQVELAGCIVRSKHGQIDQQLQTQLARLLDQLAGPGEAPA